MDKIKSASARLDELMKEREEMFKPKNPMRPGGSLDPVQRLTRALARKILDKNGVSIGKKDPIKVFDETFGTATAIDVKNLAEELLEMERMGKTSKDIDTILKQGGFFDIKIPANPSRGMTDEELEKFIKETEQEKILKDFDPTDRDPNAEGGLTRTSYAMGGGRDTGTIGEMKSKLGVLSNKVRRTSKRLDERGEPDFLEMSEGPVLPEDSTKPINPFVPKPTGPVLPDKMAFDDTPRFELKDIDELILEFEMDNGRRPTSIDDLRRYFYIKYGDEGIAKIEEIISDRQTAAYGGIMGADGRKQYGIGSYFQKLKDKVVDDIIPNEIKDNPLLTAALVAGGDYALNEGKLSKGVLNSIFGKDVVSGSIDTPDGTVTNKEGGLLEILKRAGRGVVDTGRQIFDYKTGDDRTLGSDILGGISKNIVPIVGGLTAGLFTKNQPEQPGLPDDNTALQLADLKKSANLLNQQQ